MYEQQEANEGKSTGSGASELSIDVLLYMPPSPFATLRPGAIWILRACVEYSGGCRLRYGTLGCESFGILTFLNMFLTRFLTRASGRGKSIINTVYSSTGP